MRHQRNPSQRCQLFKIGIPGYQALKGSKIPSHPAYPHPGMFEDFRDGWSINWIRREHLEHQILASGRDVLPLLSVELQRRRMDQ